MRNLRPVAVALALGTALAYSGLQAADWVRRGTDPPPAPVDLFAAELRAAIPPEARVRVVGGGATAHLLSARLHPRVLVHDGPADWIVEIPDGEFDRSRASFRKAAP